MNVTSAKIIRWAGLPAIIAGILYMATQFVHPANEAASVTTDAWAAAHYMTLGFGVLGLLGFTGIYARQIKEAGLLGFVGFVTFFLALVLVSFFAFFEAFVVPAVVGEAPQFVDDVYAIFDGGAGPGHIGTIYNLNGFLYLAGGVLFGIATIRANVLPRWAGIVFTVGTVASLSAALSDTLGRASTFVLAAGLVWMGIALWSERPAQVAARAEAVAA